MKQSTFLDVDTRNSELIEKYWSGMARNGCGHPGHKVNGLMNG